MPDITLIELDYDNTYEERSATKEDGYVSTADANVSISQRVVFPMAPPIEVPTLDQLETMPTPPIYLGDVPNAALVFRNWFKPVEHPSVFTEHTLEERTQAEAQAHAVIARQNAMAETTAEENRYSATMSQTFKLGMIAFVGLAAAAFLWLMVLVFMQ